MRFIKSVGETPNDQKQYVVAAVVARWSSVIPLNVCTQQF